MVLASLSRGLFDESAAQLAGDAVAVGSDSSPNAKRRDVPIVRLVSVINNFGRQRLRCYHGSLRGWVIATLKRSMARNQTIVRGP